MIYALAQIVLLGQSLLVIASRHQATKLTGLAVCLIFAFFAGLRGNVGTDTNTYRVMMDFFQSGYTLVLEPGYVFLAGVFSTFVSDPDFLVNMYAFVFFGIICAFIYRATHNELIYLFAYFAPLYFIGYSMNGLRIGLASAVFLLFFQSYIRRQWISAGILALISFSFHFSILVAFLMVIFFPSSRINVKGIFFRAFAFLFVIGTLIAIQEYVLEQIDSYTDVNTLGASGPLAGLSGLLKIMLFLPFTFWLPLKRGHLIQIFVGAFLIVVASFFLARFSYAGLRFMDISLWVIPLIYLISLEEGRSIGSTFAFGLVLAGNLGALMNLRNFFSTAGLGESPFIPYHFISEVVF